MHQQLRAAPFEDMLGAAWRVRFGGAHLSLSRIYINSVIRAVKPLYESFV